MWELIQAAIMLFYGDLMAWLLVSWVVASVILSILFVTIPKERG